MNRLNEPQTPPLVLVADDEINTTIMLQHIFEREGYRVERVNNGLEALEQARALHPDLILLDILMPVMNGFEVLRQLRADERTLHIPTILVTANARQPSDVALGLDLGADDYLFKPFAPQELLVRAASKIKSRKLEEALQRRTHQLEALLQASERLSQQLSVYEVLDLVIELALDLLPGEAGALYLLGDTREVKLLRALDRQLLPIPSPITTITTLHELTQRRTTISANDELTFNDFERCLSAILMHGDDLLGVLTIFSTDADSFNLSHIPLIEGVAHQAALALRNAQLYEVQAQYATSLEEMVNERTAELEAAQKLLIRSEKLASIGQLAASIAHEINNPLMPIGLLLESLIDTLRESQAQIDFHEIEMIQEHVERIRRIVRNLLDFARSGVEMGLLDVANIIDNIIALNRKFLEHERITVTQDYQALPSIYGSKYQLEAVFMNLALNAQAAMLGGGHLTISGHVAGDDIVIAFHDNGVGIEPDVIDHVFDPFFSTKPNGTGIGLFVCYSVVQGHNGSINVTSRVGEGTTFTIHLPIHQPKTNSQLNRLPAL